MSLVHIIAIFHMAVCVFAVHSHSSVCPPPEGEGGSSENVKHVGGRSEWLADKKCCTDQNEAVKVGKKGEEIHEKSKYTMKHTHVITNSAARVTCGVGWRLWKSAVLLSKQPPAVQKIRSSPKLNSHLSGNTSTSCESADNISTLCVVFTSDTWQMQMAERWRPSEGNSVF